MVREVLISVIVCGGVVWVNVDMHEGMTGVSIKRVILTEVLEVVNIKA